MKTRSSFPVTGLTVAALLTALVSLQDASARAVTDDASWAPRASEKLIKLPSNILKKAIDQDYARSPLAAAVSDTRERMQLKVKTLEELRDAVDRADGDLKTELRHQFLAEKRAYLELVDEHQTLRRKHAATRIRIYEQLLGKIKREKGAFTPQRAALIEKQKAAQERFKTSIAKVDAKLFRSSMTSESKYSREYAKNVAAIEQLVHAINAHPMNEQPDLDKAGVTREDFVRQLIGENEATLAVLDQEQSILGFMAKLVALDALALSETVTGVETAGVETQAADAGVSDAVGYFVTR
jgi:hypothetical protein